MIKRILSVDDAAIVRKIITSLMQGMGCYVSEASDGLQALDRLRHGAFDLIIADTHMPRLDGIELTRRIRASSSGLSVPIILLATDSASESKDRCREVGATELVEKPFAPRHLKALVSKILHNKILHN